MEEVTRTVEPGKALDVTMGEGRNAVFLAGKAGMSLDSTSPKRLSGGPTKTARRSGLGIHAMQSTSEAFGGLIVFEHFLHDGPAPAPKAAGAPDPGELTKLFADFAILRYEEVAGVPDWGPPLRGSETPRLAHMIARKPDSLMSAG